MGEPATRPRRLYPRTPSPLVLCAGAVVIVGAVAFLLITGGGGPPPEARGDLTYLEGSGPGRPQAQIASSIADLISADVAAEDPGTTVFTAEVVAPVPQTLRTSALEFRWQLRGDDESVWTLTISMEGDAQVALFSDGGYGSGTLDGMFPGQLVIEDTRLEVRLDIGQVEDFPSAFEWSLATTLRAFRDEPDSPRVEDRFPDEGSVGF